VSPWRIDEYRTAAAHSPIRGFIDDLDKDAQADALALIRLAEEYGNRLREPHSKALGGGLFELRRNQVRMFYIFEPGRIVRLLSGVVKKQDRIPPAVLEQARAYQREWEERRAPAKKK
jgi:hypothetical protein